MTMPASPTFDSGGSVVSGGANDYAGVRFFCPLGYEITSSQAKANNLFDISVVRAFIGFDFLRKDVGRYPVAGHPLVPDNANYHMAPCSSWPPVPNSGTGAIRENPMCGPSSGHPGGVNHLMGDGSVKTLDKISTYRRISS